MRTSDGALARYTRDLTADARAGRLDAVRCRDPEIARVVDVLLRRDKNNPVLVGEAGVGKTAIAEGLAARLAAGTVPLSLRGLRLLALDHVALLAGAMYRGQYEERLQGVVEETKRAGDVALFIDELHNLVGQGTAIGVAMDAANMLKPSLARGEFRVLGATTQAEYDRWIRADPALERRFQPVVVRELSADETLDILRVRQAVLERHHHVAIAESALVAAVRLTDLFQPDRRRPDRALDALDEACAHAHAVAAYDAESERLIGRIAEIERGARGARDEPRPSSAPHDASRRDTADDVDGDADPFASFARGGAAAFQRLGLELDAMLSGIADGDGPSAPQPAPSPRPARAADATARGEATARELTELRATLHRRLLEQGAVVRGHDVARVVSQISGKTVTWVD